MTEHERLRADDVAAGSGHRLGAAALPELAQQPDRHSSSHLGTARFSLLSGRNEITLWRLEGIWVTGGSVDLLQSRCLQVGLLWWDAVSLITSDAAPVLPVPEMLISW